MRKGGKERVREKKKKEEEEIVSLCAGDGGREGRER